MLHDIINCFQLFKNSAHISASIRLFVLFLLVFFVQSNFILIFWLFFRFVFQSPIFHRKTQSVQIHLYVWLVPTMFRCINFNSKTMPTPECCCTHSFYKLFRMYNRVPKSQFFNIRFLFRGEWKKKKIHENIGVKIWK